MIARWDIINQLIKKYDYQTYLEIGVEDELQCFDKITCKHKEGVDVTGCTTHRMSSDEFFAAFPDKQFDVIFIDGLHREEQVLRDVDNALLVLNQNGTIVLHDCNPPAKKYEDPTLCGTVWRAFVRLRMTRCDLEMQTIDVETGVGIIRRGRQKVIPTEKTLDFDRFLENKKYYLNLKPPWELKRGMVDTGEIRIELGIPCYNSVQTQCFMSCMNIMQHKNVKGCTIIQGHPVARVRNQIVDKFLASEQTHLFFLDTDEMVPKNAVDLLLECDSPMAAGIYLIIKQNGVFPCIQEEFGDPDGWLEGWSHYKEPFWADMAGTGCVLIHREVFEKMKFPWFDYEEGCYGITEDVYFARKAHGLGYRYKVHPKLYVEHFKHMPVGKFLHSFNAAKFSQTLDNELGLALEGA